jgi:hypothetical protein
MVMAGFIYFSSVSPPEKCYNIPVPVVSDALKSSRSSSKSLRGMTSFVSAVSAGTPQKAEMLSVVVPKPVYRFLVEALDNSPVLADKIAWFVSRLVILTAQGHHYKESLPDVMQPMYSKIIKTELGRHYRKILDLMLDSGIIHTDNHYIVGKPAYGIHGKCKWYGITPQYQGELIAYQITSRSLMAQLAKWRQTRIEGVVCEEKLEEIYSDANHFSMDEAQVEEIHEDLLKTEENRSEVEIETSKARNMESGLDFVLMDDYGRVHSNATNIKKAFRKSLRVDGHRISEVDLHSTQPLMFWLLCKDWLRKCSECHTGRVWEVPMGDTTRKIEIPFVKSILGEKTWCEMSSKLSRELDRFESILDGEGLYEHFRESVDVLGYKKSLKSVKVSLMKMLCGNISIRRNPVESAFVTEFPKMHSLLCLFKMDVGERPWSAVAQSLQELESNLVFNICWKRLKEKVKGIRMLTIHDSFVVREDLADDCVCVLDELMRELKLPSYWSQK